MENRDVMRKPVISTAMTATGFGDGQFVKFSRDLVLDVWTAASTAGTLKIQVSNQDEEPDWTAAASDTNRWNYIGLFDGDSGTFYAGSTGFTLGASESKHLIPNSSIVHWINVHISAISAGSVKADVLASNVQ